LSGTPVGGEVGKRLVEGGIAGRHRGNLRVGEDGAHTRRERPDVNGGHRATSSLSGVKETGTPPAGVKETGTPPAGVKETGTPPAGVKETGTPPANMSLL